MTCDELAISAMWFAGFNTFQPLNICRGGSELLLKRFGFSSEKTGMFVGETNASINYLVFWGTLCALFLSSLDRMIGNNSKWAKYITPVLSVVSSVIIIIVNCRILDVYRNCEGNDGIRKMYYWLSYAGLAYSVDMTATRKVTPDKAAEWSFGENLADVFVAILHSFIRFIMKCISAKAETRDYYLMLWHISTVLFLSIFTLILWLFHLWKNVYQDDTKSSELKDSLEWLLRLNNTLCSTCCCCSRICSCCCSPSDSCRDSSPCSSCTHTCCASSYDNASCSKWCIYLNGVGQAQCNCCSPSTNCCQGCNFKDYFNKLCELYKPLKNLGCMDCVCGCFKECPKFSNSKYQLLGNLEKVKEPLEILKKTICRFLTSNSPGCVPFGSSCFLNCCSGKLYLSKYITVTIPGITGIIKDCSIVSTSQTIQLKACLGTTVVFACDGASKSVAVSVASGCLYLKTGENSFTLNNLTFTFSDSFVATGKLQSISFTGLVGTTENRNITRLRVNIKLEITQPASLSGRSCLCQSSESYTISCKEYSGTITVSGVVKMAAAACVQVGGFQACAGFSYSLGVKETRDLFSFSFDYSYFCSSLVSSPNIQVVYWTLTCSKVTTSTFTLTVKVEPAIVLSYGTIESCVRTTCCSATDMCIRLFDFCQTEECGKCICVLKDMFPGTCSGVGSQLKCDCIDVLCKLSCSHACSPMTICITGDLTKCCLYNLIVLKTTLNEVIGCESKYDCVTNFVSGKTPAAKKGFLVCMTRCSSPALMLIIGTLILYFIYPVVAPYLMVSQGHRYITSLVMLCCSSLGSITPWILSLKQLRKCTQYKNYWTDESSAYHCVWILMIPACIIFCSFLICLHYPGGVLSRTVRFKWPAVVLCCTYHFGLYLLRRIGSGAMYANSSGTAVEDKLVKNGEAKDTYEYVADAVNGRDAYTLLIVIRYVLMVMMILYGQSYAVYYRLYTTGEMSSSPWPTQGIGGFRAFIWWAKLAGKKAYERFWDIRQTDIAAVIA